MNKKKIYFDTSAYNFILLNYQLDDLKVLIKNKYEVLFSSCNLDEFGLCEPEIAGQLASFSWDISNQKKLLDHIELIVQEMLHELRIIKEINYFDESDIGFFMAWEAMSNQDIPENFIEFSKERAKAIKEGFRERERYMRKIFNPYLQDINFSKEELVKIYWIKMLFDLEDEGGIHDFFINNLYDYYPDFKELITLDELLSIDYKRLKGTAPGVQYYLALQYVQCFQSGKLSKPDMGDQADVRHTFYAGIVDFFITNDGRMVEIFKDYVFADHGIVLTTGDFLEGYLSN